MKLDVKVLINPHLSPWAEEIVWLIFRVSAGASLFVVHGLSKLTNMEVELANSPAPFGLNQEFSFLISVISDTFCALLVAIGLLTRLSDC